MFSNPKKNLDILGITQGMKVVDFGAGAGFYSLEMAKRVGPSGAVYAVDVLDKLLHKIKIEGEINDLNNIQFIHADLEKPDTVPLKEGLVDAVVIANVLFQIDNKENIANSAKKVLRKGGKLLVIDWADSFGGLGPQPDFVFGKEKAIELFSALGFNIVNKFNAGDHHYGIIFCK